MIKSFLKLTPKKINYKIVAFVLLFIVFLTAFYLSFPKKIQTSVTNLKNQTTTKVDLPYFTSPNDETLGVYLVEIKFLNQGVGSFEQTKFKFSTLSCADKILINGKVYFVGGYELNNTNNSNCQQISSYLDLDKYLIKGENTLQFYIRGGSYYSAYYNIENNDLLFVFNSSYLDASFLTGIIVLNLFLGILLYFGLKKLGLNVWLIWIFFASLIVRQIYLLKTEFYYQSHDLIRTDGHLGYIQYMIDNQKIPQLNGWEFHQPPLYYLISALTLKISQSFGFLNAQLILQYQSLVFFGIFLVSSMFLYQLFFDSKKEKLALIISSLLLCFWPAGILHSIKVNNDALFYTIFGLVTLFNYKWYKTSGLLNKYFYFIIFILILGFQTKLTTIGLLALFLLTLPFKIYKENPQIWKDKKFNFKPTKSVLIKSLIVFFLISLPLLTYVGGRIYRLQSDGLTVNFKSITSLEIDGLEVGDNLLANRNLNSFLTFNLKNYLTPTLSKATIAFFDRSGRQDFWSYFLKTSVNGEFTSDNDIQNYCLVILYILLLIFFINLIWNFISGGKLNFRKNIYWLSILLVLLVIQIYHAVKYPYAPNSDFRYILPIIVTFGPLFFYSSNSKFNKTFNLLKVLFVIIFVVVVCIFYLQTGYMDVSL